VGRTLLSAAVGVDFEAGVDFKVEVDFEVGFDFEFKTAGGTPALQPAAYKVDDFKLIAFRQLGFRPLSAGNDIAVQFHGDAILLHTKFFDKACEGKRVVALILAVDGELHYGIDSRKELRRRARPSSM
jgi:hypothetical protein